MQIIHGLGPITPTDAAALYWEAFGPKLGRILGPDAHAVRYVAAVLSPNHVITAMDDGGRLLGIAGFRDARGCLVGGGYRGLVRGYGPWGGTWRAAALGLLERDVDNDRFLIDGLCVTAPARGHGVGTALLAAIGGLARSRGYTQVRLDVVDHNTRAQALYERLGFQAVGEHPIGPLRHVFGFRSATTMVQTLS